MILADTHTHLYVSEFDEDRNAVVERALEKGVRNFFLPNIDHSSVESLNELCDQWPEHMFPMMGLHPTSVRENYEEQIEQLFARLQEREYFAVGEIGIDLYWDQTYEAEQRKAFQLQCEKAAQWDLPVSVHMRNSYEALLEELQRMDGKRPKGIFHCFTGNRQQAEEITDLGFYLGIGGVLTFKNSGLGQEIRDIPLEHIVLETDSPYLSPHPHRGKRNESAYLRLIARKLADVKDVSLEEVAEKTTRNAQEIFKY
jgi:TatD DNase family protein